MENSAAYIDERNLRTIIGKDGQIIYTKKQDRDGTFYKQHVWYNGTWRLHSIQRYITTEYEEVWYFNHGFHMNGPDGCHNVAKRINGTILYQLIFLGDNGDGRVLLRYSNSTEIYCVWPE